MTKAETLALIDKYLAGETSPEEEDLLVMLMESFQTTDEWDEDELGSSILLETRLKDRLDKALRKRRLTKKKWLPVFYPWLKIAAFIVLLLSVAVYFFSDRVKKSPSKVSEVAHIANDIAPGGDIATLTLSDGSVIPLNDATGEQVYQSEGIRVQKTEAGQLVYTVEKDPAGRSQDLAFNILSTPKGGQYQVVLPDGSKVWLNAESSLRFPTIFEGPERKVELKGEAYFEVAKDEGKRFVVNTEGMKVEVFGTHFNVNAYEKTNLSATLVEGSVKVNNATDNVLLKPGQVARVDINKEKIEKAAIDVETILAWKNGYFVFDNENIQSIMIKLSRWYDAEVEYIGNMSAKNFNARISRRSNISEVLQMLELTGTIHYKIEGRKVTIMN